MIPAELSVLSTIWELLQRSGPLAVLLWALWKRYLVLGWTYEAEKELNARLTQRLDALTKLALRGTNLAEAFAEQTKGGPS